MRHSELLKTLQFVTNRKIKQQDLADALGVSVNTISSRASRDSEYSTEETKRIGEYFNCDLLKAAYIDNFAAQYELVRGNNFQNESKDCISMKYYPDVFGSCGTGTFVFSECTELIDVPRKIIENFSKIKKYSVINAYGDSMMPNIHDRDLLVVEHYEGEQITDNRVYVFRFEDKIFIKRLVLNINQLIIKSDNSMYQPIVIDLTKDSDIQIVGKIVGLMRGMA